MRIDRFTTIDLSRGILFILMMNTHALTIAGVPRTHWLYSSLWLPNGWATVVFVVLSGYSVGYIYSMRESLDQSRKAIFGRGLDIIMVMIVSNSILSILRQILSGHGADIATLQWWLGFITLDTQWTISGVLMPTALMLFGAPAMLVFIKKSPWMSIVLLATVRILVSFITINFQHSEYSTTWFVRFFFTEGFGGFPLLRFVLNGFIGVWMGVYRHKSEKSWRVIILVLLILHLLTVLLIGFPDDLIYKIIITSFGAMGKFSVIVVTSVFLIRFAPEAMVNQIELVGRYALGSFVMHRVFFHAIAFITIGFGMNGGVEMHYCILVAGTFILTWALCKWRLRSNSVNDFLGRLAL